MRDEDRELLQAMFAAAVAVAEPGAAMRSCLPEPPRGRTVVIGAGKGAAQMAAAFEQLWAGPIEGVVVTRYGFGAETQRLRVLEAAHPVPDAAGVAASDALVQAVDGLGEEDLVVALISGGGSALLAAPAEGLELADEIALNEALLASGAPIGAMNAIRKMVSRVKGGRLAAAAHPARVVSLIVSDVPGDAPWEVASGPTVPGPGGRSAALAAVRDYAIALPGRVADYLERAEEPPQPGDAEFEHDKVHIIASAAKSLEAAAEVARDAGYTPVILSDAIEGEAREVAKVHAAIAREVATRQRPFAPPVAILSGGETTVTLRGSAGKGGRNSEFLLSFALAIDGVTGIAALAADTDGVDGSEDNAGAFADGGTAAAMRAAGVDPAAALAGNDAWSAFEAVGGLFEPGPTGTNVNDLRVILVR
ncbi:glycerate kinase type-2 family protein [Marimonas arenosa]|uniref:Glycerate kinase n=1 Tax=Marimonas arenosa TaxID=1795305 RepID=A0AAE3WF54_9RHOB|nr:glycerate kinase [Marimonas arenosa]MDQ2090508.1 glycerate kinase [Marimonas arenosa]